MPRRRQTRRWQALALALLGAVAAVGIAAAAVPSSEKPAAQAGAGALPLPVAPAFVPGRPRPLGSTRHLSHWATVKRPAVARVAPTAGAAVVAAVPTVAPEGTPSAVAVIAQRQDDRGRVWVHVRLPVLPNGTTGWVRRRALGGYETVDTRLDVDLARLRATLYRDGRTVLRAPVGVGSPGWPTPRGEFYVRNKLTRYRSPAYGPVAFGTSARSPAATGWPAGGFVGIHGTDRPDLVPGRVSHGCIRMRNADIRALARRMPVGTPLTIH
jgi:lipoprotein-anchoring transpeptidase ErfK/SrfK